MADDKNKTEQDRNFINVNEDYELEYWTKELGITKEQLMDAVAQVGTSAKAVRELVGK